MRCLFSPRIPLLTAVHCRKAVFRFSYEHRYCLPHAIKKAAVIRLPFNVRLRLMPYGYLDMQGYCAAQRARFRLRYADSRYKQTHLFIHAV